MAPPSFTHLLASKSSIVSTTGKTRLRQALERARDGGPACIALWLWLPGYSLARLVGGLGADSVMVDCEHGNIDDSEMYQSVGALASAGSSPIIRTVGSEPMMIKRAIDCGAHAVMIPMCESKAQVEQAVRYMKYPSKRWPQGVRGAGTIFAPPTFHQNDEEYFDSANDNVVFIAQVESRLGVQNCEEIAAVDGVDMLFIGPSDLASSMGHSTTDHPEVRQAAARVRDAAHSHGKFSGHFAVDAKAGRDILSFLYLIDTTFQFYTLCYPRREENANTQTVRAAAQRVKEGYHFVNCGEDVSALSSWFTAEMGMLKRLTAKL